MRLPVWRVRDPGTFGGADVGDDFDCTHRDATKRTEEVECDLSGPERESFHKHPNKSFA